VKAPRLRSPEFLRILSGTVGSRALAGLIVATLACALDLDAQSRFRPPPSYIQIGEPDQAEGSKILSEFRTLGIAGDYALDFDLRVMPRRGPERLVSGRMLGARDNGADVTLIKFDEASVMEPRVLLIRKGVNDGVWSYDGKSAEAHKLTEAELFLPVAGTELTAFDLQMPFLNWFDAVYEGLAKLRGRPSHQFIVYPPPKIAEAHTELTGVRFHLDAQFNALVQAELIGDAGRVLKTITVLELKKTQEQWVVKTVDLRNDTTRDKTRFRVTAAALGIRNPLIIFQPSHLPFATPEIPRERFESFR